MNAGPAALQQRDRTRFNQCRLQNVHLVVCDRIQRIISPLTLTSARVFWDIKKLSAS